MIVKITKIPHEDVWYANMLNKEIEIDFKCEHHKGSDYGNIYVAKNKHYGWIQENACKELK